MSPDATKLEDRWVQSRLRLRLPIVLAIVMIVMLLALTVGWVILAVRSALDSSSWAPLYWILLSVGAVFFVLTVVGVVVYLTLSIKAINLSQRQSNFIDSVTHELKSPIASLKLYLQTLTRHQPSAEERQEFYQSMLDDVERLDQLINHVLDAARLDRPAAPTQQAVALDELLRRCAEDVCNRYRITPDTIQLQLKPCNVMALRADLELVFRNLLDNAVKYAGTPPEVMVTMDQATSGRVRVRISDNGHGIPHKFRDKVFGRFVRLGTELEREQPGLGLGLYIVRTLVGRLRGHVRVRGREDATGTTFEVLLPGVLQTDGQRTGSAALVAK
jgi:signal transduction histidine kinase